MEISLPRNLVNASRRECRTGWLATLPATVANLQDRWSLTIGEPFQPGGQTAWVAPADRRSGRGRGKLVLKVGWRHVDTEHEAECLQVWDGDGAVRLYESERFGKTIALLLERCVPGTALATLPQAEQDEIVARLLRRLWRPPPPQHRFRSLRQMCDEWADEFEQEAAHGGVELDPGLARDGITLLRSLPDSAQESVLLCTDLHAENVLAARREPWLVIDPNPYVGDPAHDPVQHMLNCDDRLIADPLGLADRMAHLLDLDRDRLRLWLFARCVQESPGWPGLADVARRVAP